MRSIKILLTLIVLCIATPSYAQATFTAVNCRSPLGTVFVEQVGLLIGDDTIPPTSVLPNLQQMIEGVTQRSNCFQRAMSKEQAQYVLSLSVTSMTSVIDPPNMHRVTQYSAVINVAPREKKTLEAGHFAANSYYGTNEPAEKVTVRNNQSVANAVYGAWNATIRTIVPEKGRFN